jgi:hypothetical protein
MFATTDAPGRVRHCLKPAIERRWLEMHESGTFVTFRRPAPILFA